MNQIDQPDDADDAELDVAGVAAFFGISLSSVNRARKANRDFPTPLRLNGPRSKPTWTRGRLRAYRAKRLEQVS